ncbi:TPA: holin [Klebsiella variicola subsp. variicola]|nr:holin [Klebsiella variicola subsp. variicola]
MFANYETLFLALLLSLLSGTGVFLHGVREKRIPASFFNLITEWVMALVAGLTGFYVARNQGWEESLLYVVVLVASNNGREVTSAIKTKFIAVLNGLMGGGKGGSING